MKEKCLILRMCNLKSRFDLFRGLLHAKVYCMQRFVSRRDLLHAEAACGGFAKEQRAQRMILISSDVSSQEIFLIRTCRT
jgi:hypothetical protein